VREPSAKYVVPSGYRRTEVGVIPEDWDVAPLVSVVPPNVKNGIVDGPFGSNLKTIHYRNSGIPIITSGYVTDGRFHAEQYLYVDQAKFNEEKRSAVRPGDIVMAKIGERCGASAILPEKHDIGILSGNALKITVDTQRHSTFYVWQVLWNLYSSGGMELMRTVGAQPAISMANLKNHKIPLPRSKAEQEAIAEALNDGDALIESLEQLLAKKRQLKHGAMQELLTGKRRLRGFSGKWLVRALGDVAETDPENLRTGTPQDFTFNYISLEDVDRGVLRSHSEQKFRSAPSRARRKLRKDDVLVATVRPNLLSHLLFNIDTGEWVCSTGFCVVRCRQDVAHPGFVYFHMFARPVASQVEALLTGSNYPSINGSDVRALRIPLPGYEEQAAIAATLYDMDAEIAGLESKLAKARSVKQGMMQELLTGRIRLVHCATEGVCER